MVFIPGFSTLKGEPQDPEENAKAYEESQQQRALERKLREDRRDLAVMKAQGANPEEIKAQRERVKKASQDIDDFCDETGRARKKSREGTPINAKFPPKKSYDSKLFPTEERDKIRDWYKNGGMDNNPPPQPANIHLWPDNIPPQGQAQIPVMQKPPESGFVPAQTIEEAEKFAETFTDKSRWGALGVSYNGINVDVANEVNKTISEFYNQYNVEKFGGIIAPAGNTKYGKMVNGAVAGYMPARHSFILNRKDLKSLKIAEKGFLAEQELVKKYIANPELFDIKNKAAKKVLDASRVSGRATVPNNAKEAIWHELGHSLEKPLRNVGNYDKIKEGFNSWAETISGYATTEFSEYVAESFCAWNKGETIDPELISGFMSLRR
jgi:hypothetical protein